jgi:hypothetical protein
MPFASAFSKSEITARAWGVIWPPRVQANSQLSG